MSNTNTNTNTNTLASRAAALMTKASALAVVEKAMAQAIEAKRVYPALAQDFGAQLGYEMPLKTKDFVKVVGHLLSASEKPLKGAISKKKGEILAVLADLVAALTDTAPIALPSWAVPKERAKKEEPASIDGTLDRANAEAAANESAEMLALKAAEAAEAIKASAKGETELAKALALIVARVGELSEAQRSMLAQALASTEPALM